MENKPEKCEWPGCNKDAFCRSGNVSGAFVCQIHFAVTNGKDHSELNSEEIVILSFMAAKCRGRMSDKRAVENRGHARQYHQVVW